MKISSGLKLREIAGQWVIMPMGQRLTECKSILTLSESGAMIWMLIEEGADEEDIVRTLLSEYDADESIVRKDVQAFIECMKSKGLFE